MLQSQTQNNATGPIHMRNNDMYIFTVVCIVHSILYTKLSTIDHAPEHKREREIWYDNGSHNNNKIVCIHVKMCLKLANTK